jgi:hypothetical protein
MANKKVHREFYTDGGTVHIMNIVLMQRGGTGWVALCNYAPAQLYKTTPEMPEDADLCAECASRIDVINKYESSAE